MRVNPIRYAFASTVAVGLLLPAAGLALAHTTNAHPAAAKPLMNVGKAKVSLKITKVLVGSKGLTLYHQTTENTGTITCKAACLAAWPPLLLPAGMKKPTAGKGVADKLGVIARPDISKTARQVTYDGWPLYYWKNDLKPGQATGQGIFHFFVVPPAPMVSFKINITNTGTTWGTVTVKGKYLSKPFTKTCSNKACTLSLHAGVQLTFTQTPTDQTTWPFQMWEVKSADGHVNVTSSNSLIKVKSNDDYTVNADYVAAGGY
jgi:predicted lipoprotein with Yx(FWY)xxD motif